MWDKKSIIDQLSLSQHRIDQGPNQLLARRMTADGGREGIQNLIELLRHPDNKVVYDVLLVLAHMAQLSPEMPGVYLNDFFPLLKSKVNNHVWACMILIARLTPGNEKLVFSRLAEILDGMKRSTVVARDHGVRILVTLYKDMRYREDAFALFLEQLLTAPDNQLGQYAMRMYDVIHPKDKQAVTRILEMRLSELLKEAHRRRVSRIIRQYQS